MSNKQTNFKQFSKKIIIKSQKQDVKCISYGTKLTTVNPLLRYVIYKKHTMGLAKKNEYTSIFNKEIIESQQNASKDTKVIDNDLKDRILFTINLSSDATPEQVAQLFERFGPVTSVRFGDLLPEHERMITSIPLHSHSEINSNPFVVSGVAHIVFKESEAVQKAMKVKSNTNETFSVEGQALKGLEKYYHNYRSRIIKDPAAETKKINSWMREFDKRAQREEDLIQALRGKPDADGWIKVIAPRGQRHKGPLHASELPQKPKEEVKAIYKFQRIEKKREKMQKLREKFEEDKKRIAQLRAKRKFKPL